MRIRTKYLYLLITIVAIGLVLVGCGTSENSGNKFEKERTTTLNSKNDNNYYDDEGYIDEEDGLIPITLWEDVKVTYKGWAGFGEIDKISFSEDSEFYNVVNEYISFVPEEEYHNLKDDDKIQIKAQYDEALLKREGYVVEEPVGEIFVFGVPHIIASSLYHDGMVWAYVGTGGIEQWMAIDTNGNVNVKLDANSVPDTKFSKGISIVDNKRVINKNGETIWSAEEQGNAYATEQWGADHIKNISVINNGHNNVTMGYAFDYIEEDFWGYPQVSFEVETFDYTGTYTGVLDEKGDWYLEPTELKGSFWDGEDGVYRASRYYENPYSLNGREGFYNLLENQFIWEVDISSDEYEDTLAKWRRDAYIEKHNGLFFESLGGGSNYLFIETGIWDPGFYDMSGKQIIDLTRYPSVSYSPIATFYDGYCIIEIYNEQKSPYYTVLDTSGKEMFAPRKRDDEVAEKVSEGLFWEHTSEKGTVYYKPTGEQAFQLPFKIKKGTDFSEGRALLEAEDGVIYVIDLSGKLLF